MDQIRVRGGAPLRGTIPISGAKNAALPLMAATLLTDQDVTLSNVPDLADIASMVSLLRQHGMVIDRDGETARMNASEIVSTVAPYDLVRKMRASVLVLGPLLARFGEASVSMPGGCAIGNRPVDMHLKGLEALGAIVDIDGGYIKATAQPVGLSAAGSPSPSSLSEQRRTCSRRRRRQGRKRVGQRGARARNRRFGQLAGRHGREDRRSRDRHHSRSGNPVSRSAAHRVIPDRIEIGTYAIAVGVAGGDVLLEGADASLLETAFDVLRQSGLSVETEDKGVRVKRGPDRPLGIDIMTEPFPGFPTDLQCPGYGLNDHCRRSRHGDGNDL